MAILNSTVVNGNLAVNGSVKKNGVELENQTASSLSAVQYISQTLSDAQKLQARTNIGAPATNVIPAESTASKFLMSTSTSGTAAWSDKGTYIKDIATEYTRITDLNSGLYRLTYRSGAQGPKLYYDGTSGPAYIHLSADLCSDAPLLSVVQLKSSDGTTYAWQWCSNAYYLDADIAGEYPYGSTSSSSGSYNTMRFTDTNYYPSRSYSSGLQISSSIGITNTCALYVPYASTSQKGVVSISTNSGLSVSSGALSVNFGTAYSAVPRGSHQHCWQDDLGNPQRNTGVDSFINNFFSYCDDNLDMDDINAVRGFFSMSLLNAGMPWDVYQIDFYTEPYIATVYAYNYETTMSLTMSIEAKSSEITCVVKQPGSASTTSYFDAGDTNAVFDYWFIRSITSN